MKFGKELFRTKLLSQLSDKVCRLFSSPVHYYGLHSSVASCFSLVFIAREFGVSA